MLKLDDQTLLHLRVKGIANESYLCSGRNVLWCAGDGSRGVCSSDVHRLVQKSVSAAEMQFIHATRSPRASQIAGRVVCGSKVDIAEGVSARSRSTIGGGGDSTIPSPRWSSKQPLPGIGLHDPLHDRQAYPEFASFHQGVGQICPREGLFSCRPLPKRGQICDIPDPPNR